MKKDDEEDEDAPTSQPTSIDENDIAQTLSFTPQPVIDIATLEFNSICEGNYTATILDLSGAIVYELSGNANIGNNVLSVDINKFNTAASSYLIQIAVCGKLLTSSFIILK